jgi:hypothetical protein
MCCLSLLLQTAELEMARDGLTTLQETVAAYEATISDKDRELHQLQDLCSTLNATVRERIGVRERSLVCEGGHNGRWWLLVVERVRTCLAAPISLVRRDRTRR